MVELKLKNASEIRFEMTFLLMGVGLSYYMSPKIRKNKKELDKLYKLLKNSPIKIIVTDERDPGSSTGRLIQKIIVRVRGIGSLPFII